MNAMQKVCRDLYYDLEYKNLVLERFKKKVILELGFEKYQTPFSTFEVDKVYVELDKILKGGKFSVYRIYNAICNLEN